MNGDIGTMAFNIGTRRYVNVTNRCTLRCRFCPRTAGCYNVHGQDLRLKREPSVGEIAAAVGDARTYDEIVFSGLGEPTLRLYDVLDAIVLFRRPGVRVSLVTDGLASLVYGRDVVPDMEGLIDSLWVSLNAQDGQVYRSQCEPPIENAYESLLEFCANARDYISQVTLTAIVGVDGVDVEACDRIASRLGVDFHRRQPNELF